jgi:hypothetical protein
MAPRALSTSAARSVRLAKRVRPLRRLPALSWLPGQRPAQDAAWPAVGKRTHVAAEFGEDGLGRAPRDPGNGVEPGQRVAVRRGERRDVAITSGDGVIEELDVMEELREHEAVMGRHAPGERLPEGQSRRHR